MQTSPVPDVRKQEPRYRAGPAAAMILYTAQLGCDIGAQLSVQDISADIPPHRLSMQVSRDLWWHCMAFLRDELGLQDMQHAARQHMHLLPALATCMAMTALFMYWLFRLVLCKPHVSAVFARACRKACCRFFIALKMLQASMVPHAALSCRAVSRQAFCESCDSLLLICAHSILGIHLLPSPITGGIAVSESHPRPGACMHMIAWFSLGLAERHGHLHVLRMPEIAGIQGSQCMCQISVDIQG